MKFARSKLGVILVLGLLSALLPIGSVTPAVATTGDLVISGVVDGPLTGGIPKAIELYAVNAIPDLSIYGVGSANNGGGSNGEEFTFPADSAIAGDFIYVASEAVGFNDFFGFTPNYTSSAASINGDDAIELFKNGAVVDVFGDINVDGTGQPWEYKDGWAYRVNETGADGSTFVLANWTFSGPDALDGETSNATAAVPFPIGVYTGTATGPPPATGVFLSELHYDNAGADVGEFVEVTGDKGGDLAGWSVVLYNGNGGASYATIDISSVIPDEDGSQGAVAFSHAGIQNGAPDGLALVDAGGVVVEFWSYEGTFTAVGGPADGMLSIDMGVSQPGSTPIGQSLQVLSGVWTGPADESPGLLNTEPPVATEEKIYDVQGFGPFSPLEGQQVIVEGVVTSDQQDGLRGFFMQEVIGDGIEETSDGIFVSVGGSPVVANVGDVVKVEGTVVEHYGETQIGSVVDTAVTGSASFSATVVALPWLDLFQPEWYEGMYITVPQPLTISEYFNFDRYGEIVLTVGRPSIPTAVYDPGSVDQGDLALANQLGRITLDDNRTSQNPDPAIHPNGAVFDLDNLFRGGDIVENVTGAMSYSFGSYKIQPTQGADYTSTNPRSASPGDVGGDLAVATFNVLNYFTTIDNSGPICGPDEDQGCRGADSDQEFERQRTKIIAAIAEINADVVGLMEIENFVDGGIDEPIADLVSGINDVLGTGTYAAVETGAIGGDAIKVAFIYKPATVSLNGGYAVLDGSVDPAFNDDKNRPALAQTFTENATGESVTVAVNHLKSKGSSCSRIGDPNLDDGAGNCNLTRTSAAEALVSWLAGDATGTGEDDVLVIGDLNSYDKEDPIDALIAGGYSDLVADFGGEFAYSYVFSGEWGYLDYAMANESLRPWITGTTVWHINADEPDILDYNLGFKQPPQQALYESNAYRSSDHDPVIVGLDLPSPKVDKEAVVTDLEALLPTGDRKTDMQINKAIDAIDASLNDGWWTSDQTITNKKVFDNERNAVVQLMLVVAAGGPEAVAAQDAIDVLVNADRQLAQIELIAAIARDGKASKIADAQMAMAYAADLTMAGLYNEAVNAYKTAWDAATKA